MSKNVLDNGIINYPYKAEIPGFSRYYATSDGEVYSKNYNHTGKPGIMAGKVTKDGYIELLLRNDSGHKIYIRKHRIIAMAFIPNPNSLPQVNHKNGIKSNCAPYNLEWSTQSDNIQHGYAHNLYSRKSSIVAVNLETKQTSNFNSIAEAGRTLNIHSQNIWKVLNMKMMSYKGYTFYYDKEGGDNNDHQ